MDNNKKIKIYIGLLITVTILIGVTYAYYRLYKTQTNDNVIGTRSCLDTSFTEDTSEIILSDAFPIDDSDGLQEDPFSFTLTNNCDSYVDVQITLYSEYRTSTSSTYLKDDYVKVNLSPKGATTGTSNILSALSLGDIDTTRKAYILEETGLKGNETKSYDLRLWMNSETTNEQGLNKTWKGKIIVTVTAAKELPTFAETILAKNEVKAPITTPGAAVSTASEALLASTEDDYGTSYYFRGAVTNNYVQFANKCWRIVRVGGDGSVKLILHNDNTAGAANPCAAANNSASAAFARYSGTTYKSAFNTNYDDNAYVGFMYGNVGCSDGVSTSQSSCTKAGGTWTASTSYANAHANINKSTILTNLETWYNNNLKTYEKVIADTVWCNDKTNVTDTSYDPWSENPNGYGYAKNVTYYGTTQRLVSTSTIGSAGGTGPSLKCNRELSKITSKIGLITADELALAGYAFGRDNTTTYLLENATGYWWTLSPFDFIGDSAHVWYVNGGDGIFGSDYVDRAYGVRPSISLKPSTNVTGEGTSENPYKIVS